MAVDIKALFVAYNTKIGEKLNSLKTQIDDIVSNGVSGGISADIGNNLTLGTDGKVFYKEPTALEWQAAYEALPDVNRFTDNDVLNLNQLLTDIANKADLDPVTGRLISSQMPYMNITNTIPVGENTLDDFLLVTNAYTYEVGDVIAIDDGFGNWEYWLYNGGDREVAGSYYAINPGQVKFYTNAGDKPVSGKAGFLYVVTTSQTIEIWEGGQYKTIIGGSGSDKNYLHVQGSASATWNIPHNLGKYPTIVVLNSANDRVEGDVNYPDLNNATVTFGGAMSGKASCN